VGEIGVRAALIKGGHRDGAPDDLLVERGDAGVTHSWLRGERIARGPVRGTGCVLASAIAAHLARGEALPAAVEQGRAFLRDALAAPAEVGARGRLLAF